MIIGKILRYQSFYDNCVAPEIVNPIHKQGLSLSNLLPAIRKPTIRKFSAFCVWINAEFTIELVDTRASL